MIYQLPNPLDVLTPLGDCTAIMIIDYGVDVNTVWVCRMPGGYVKHFYSDDIRIYNNPMNGKGWDVVGFDCITKLPSGLKRKPFKKLSEMENEAKKLIKENLTPGKNITDFEVYKARKKAIDNCTDNDLKEVLKKTSYSAKDFK